LTSPALIACPHCGRRGRAPANAAGRLARCPGCQQTFAAVPGPDPDPLVAEVADGGERHRPKYGPAERIIVLPFVRGLVWIGCLLGMFTAAVLFAVRPPGLPLFAGDALLLKFTALLHAAGTLIWMLFLYAVARGFDAMTRR
jgi:hypothetical protein